MLSLQAKCKFQIRLLTEQISQGKIRIKFKQIIYKRQMLSSVKLKNSSVVVLYKNHIFPGLTKPIKSITDFLSMRHPDLDIVKVRKMKQILDEDEKKRINQQRNLLNQEINANLQKYYFKFIQPFETCPDYYRLLFNYAIQKTEWLAQNKSIQGQNPFMLTKRQIKQILSLMSQEASRKANLSTANKQISDEQNNPQNPVQQIKGEEKKKKLLFEVYRQLYPSEKAEVYSIFNKAYKEFLMKEQSVTQEMLQANVIHLKPFMYISPVELYQSKHPQKSLEQCEEVLIDNLQERQKTCLEFGSLIEQRENELNMIAEKFKTDGGEVKRKIWEQYILGEKERTFYHLLKYRNE